MSEVLRSFKFAKNTVLLGLGFVAFSPVVGLDDDISALIHGQGAVEFSENNLTIAENLPINEIGRKMQDELGSYEVVDPNWALSVAQDKGSSVYLGEQISVEDAMRYNYIAGFRGKDLIMKTAIDGKESNYHPGAVGDVNWNYSGDRAVGTSQIYCQPNGSLKCEGVRDWRDNFHPQINAINAFKMYSWAIGGNRHDNGLSSDGRFADWRNNPENTRAHLPQAREAFANLSQIYGKLD